MYHYECITDAAVYLIVTLYYLTPKCKLLPFGNKVSNLGNHFFTFSNVSPNNISARIECLESKEFTEQQSSRS